LKSPRMVIERAKIDFLRNHQGMEYDDDRKSGKRRRFFRVSKT